MQSTQSNLAFAGDRREPEEMKIRAENFRAAVLVVLCATTAVSRAADDSQPRIKSAMNIGTYVSQ